MLPKLVLIVSCLYVVQATFVVNASDDVDDGIANAADTTQTVRSCGYAECNQFCRKLGFMCGVCIGTYCQCRNFRSRDVVMRPGIPNKDLVTIEDNSLSFDEDAADSKSEAVQQLAACDEKVCDRYCRTWRYHRGICVISRCRCLGRPIWFRDHDGSEPHNAINEEASNVQNANDVNSKLMSSDEILDNNAAEIASNESDDVIFGNAPSETDSGNDEESENETTDQKFIDAEDATRNTEQALPQNNLETVGVSSRACCSLSCGRRCQWIGFDCGICVYPCKCECRYKGQCPRGFGVSEEAVEPKHQRSCNPRLCEQNCRRIGLRGTCVSGRCMCGSLRSAVPNHPLEPLSEVAAPQPLDDCNPRSCDQTCRRIGFPGGACVNGRCKCDILRSAVPASALEPLSEEAAPQPLDDCNSRSCDQTCRRIGFPGGACVNGLCKCDILRSAVPASALEPLSEEVAPQPLSDCNWVWCEQTCRRIGFPGGACSNGRCKCDILRSQRPPLIPVPRDD